MTTVEIDAPPVDQPVRRRPRWGRWVAAAAVLAALAGVVALLLASPNLDDRPVPVPRLRAPRRAGHAVAQVVAMVLGLAGGAVLAVMRLSPNPVLRGVSWLFVWVFRGTPLLVQIIFFGFLGALFPTITLAVPFTDAVLFSQPTSVVISGTTAAVLAL